MYNIIYNIILTFTSWQFRIYLHNAIFRQNHQMLIVQSLLDILFNVGHTMANKTKWSSPHFLVFDGEWMHM